MQSSSKGLPGKWQVVNTGTGAVAQEELLESTAIRARDSLNAHEAWCGRPAVYEVKEKR